MEPLISIDNLRVIYNQGKSNESRALEETNLRIYPKEYVIIYGPSGCGKSTLLYSIAGLQKPTYGDISINGKAFSKMTRKETLELHQTGIGLIFQAFYLIPSLTILDNVCLPRAFRSQSRSEREKDGIQSLRRFGIVEQADKYPSQLSGGQKQRVAIARALVNKPQIVLADEPVGNLDSESARNVLQILKELNEVDEQTIIMVTHNPEHLAYADRVIHMRDGRVIKEEVNKDKRPVEAKKEEETRPVEETPEMRELSILMSSFKSLLPQQVNMLLVPYKAKQLLNHLLSDLNEEQVSIAETLVREVLFRNIESKTLCERLDLDYDRGGGGWNKTRAEHFTERMDRILEQTESLKAGSPESVSGFADYLVRAFHLRLDEKQSLRLRNILSLRIESKIGQAELKKRLDAPVRQDGVGLHSQTAEKIARDVEIVMLLKYS
ncbi:MAG: ABC transporter ATP-binding protein [Candidatus Moranbacteria bacterium]|nr:ABC transporter ATP-binding protein [Candidatus Moranbacteria bacterium]